MARASARLFERLHALSATRHGAIVDVRGAGLIAGIELAQDALPVVAAALERGLVVNRTQGTVIRLLPPYIITERDVDEAVDILDASLRAAGF
jgi:4-aminobutyrate aminotransferase-like enzyme